MRFRLLLPLIATVSGAWGLDQGFQQPTGDVIFFWDFAPQRFDLDIEGAGHLKATRGDEFDNSARAGFRYLMEMPGGRPGAGTRGGVEIAYADYSHDTLDYQSVSFSGLFGGYAFVRPGWRLGLDGRLGIGFDRAEVSPGVLIQSGVGTGFEDYGLASLQYGIAASSDFLLGPRAVLSLSAGYQGTYASAVSWWYYYDQPNVYLKVVTYGPVLSAGLGFRF